MSIVMLSMLLNVMWVDGSGLHVGTVVNRSGFEIDVVECYDSGWRPMKKRIRENESTVVHMSCKEYLDTTK